VEYLPKEIVKIIEWGLKGDPERVNIYLNKLIEKLMQEGDVDAMKRLRALQEKAASPVTTSAIGYNRQLPVDGESRLELADEEILDPKNYKVILDTNTHSLIEEFIAFVKNVDELEAHGIYLSPSLITYGPPGTGKTQLARYIAGRLGMPLVIARTDALISSFLGSTSKNLRNLFDHVSQRSCILFLDEIDALAKLRDDHQELGELKRVVVSLLQNLDAMSHHTVLLAATNHEHLLDPAIWRRFSFKIPLKVPEEKERKELLKLYFGSFQKGLNFDLFTSLTNTMTGSDIRTLALDAIRDTVINKLDTVNSDRLVWSCIRICLNNNIITENPSSQDLKAIKKLNSTYFTGLKLAEMFGVSPATISRKLGKREANE